jgi:outer membrane lipoprotein-sorting protein
MTIVRSAIVLACALVATGQVPQAPAKPSPAADLWERARAAFGALKTYSDTGTLLSEFGASSQERHSFETAFSREPRRFLFDFKKQGGDRYVIWGDPDAFHTWWKSTSVQQDYPNPNNAGALTLAGPITVGAASKIPTLLYAKAQLPGDFANVKDLSIAGTEAIDGQPCQRVTGTAYDVYGATGNRVNERALTVWFDSASLLIRKVVEEWKPLPGQVNRRTTTIQPIANPTLDDSRFRFVPPGKSH